MDRPKKSLGQNFLKNKEILSRIVSYGNITKNDIILEIGPGTGNLTNELLKKNPKELIVVEKDDELAKIIKNKYGRKVNVVNKDILNIFKRLRFNKPIKVFGNLPYNISTKILTSFLKLENLNTQFNKFIFIFQKEVADRIIAKENTKEYGRLSILTSWKMYGEKKFDIDPINFYPKPKVWSSLITLTPKTKIEKLKKSSTVEHVTNIFFTQRRNMIRKPMKQLFSNYEYVSSKLEMDLNLRPQNLSTNKYLEICKIFEKLT